MILKPPWPLYVLNDPAHPNSLADVLNIEFSFKKFPVDPDRVFCNIGTFVSVGWEAISDGCAPPFPRSSGIVSSFTLVTHQKGSSLDHGRSYRKKLKAKFDKFKTFNPFDTEELAGDTYP